MIKVNVMYPYTEGARFDHAYYRDRHMPMVKARLGSACANYTDITPVVQVSEVVIERSDPPHEKNLLTPA